MAEGCRLRVVQGVLVDRKSYDKIPVDKSLNHSSSASAFASAMGTTKGYNLKVDLKVRHGRGDKSLLVLWSLTAMEGHKTPGSSIHMAGK